MHLGAQLHSGAYALIAAVIWTCLTCLARLGPPRWRQAVFWGVVMSGVPVLGWLTFAFGPGVGVATLALGLLLVRTSLSHHDSSAGGTVTISDKTAPDLPANSAK